MRGNECLKINADWAIPGNPVISADSLALDSALEPMCFTLTAKRITLMDEGIQIELLEPQREWFLKHGISKIKINDATFALEGKE